MDWFSFRRVWFTFGRVWFIFWEGLVYFWEDPAYFGEGLIYDGQGLVYSGHGVVFSCPPPSPRPRAFSPGARKHGDLVLLQRLRRVQVGGLCRKSLGQIHARAPEAATSQVSQTAS